MSMFNGRKKFFAGPRTAQQSECSGFVSAWEALDVFWSCKEFVVSNNRGRILAEFWGL